MTTFPGVTVNGQLVAAVAVLVDAVAGVLVAVGVIHTAPDQTVVAVVVASAFNAAAFVLAYLQHRTSVVKATLAHEMTMRNNELRASNVKPGR